MPGIHSATPAKKAQIARMSGTCVFEGVPPQGGLWVGRGTLTNPAYYNRLTVNQSARGRTTFL
jgi:hypothetical protein